MTVYIVMQSYPNIDLVDDQLNIYPYDIGEVVGVYHREEDAKKRQEELLEENGHDVIALECDPIDVWIDERTVQ